jgi:hypothetical protein
VDAGRPGAGGGCGHITDLDELERHENLRLHGAALAGIYPTPTCVLALGVAAPD